MSQAPAQPVRKRFAFARKLFVAAVVLAALAAVPVLLGYGGGFSRRNVGALPAEIDAKINARLASEGLPTAPRADDAVFVRRAYLDLTGRVPTADEARAFLDNPAADKHARLIRELVYSRDYARWQADLWDGYLFYGGGYINSQIDARPLTKWLEEQFYAGRPWNQMAREVLTATGSQHEDGRVTPFITARKSEESVALMGRAFLGVRLDCAQCHNHPYAEFTHEDFWGMAAFFEKVNVDTGYAQFDNNELMRAGIGLDVGAKIKVSESAQPVERKKPPRSLDAAPKFLCAATPALRPEQPRRPALARWVTSPENPYFAKAMVNRVWWQIFGVGLVTPYDDFHAGNPPTHPELLDLLAESFIASGYDIRYITEAICRTELYRRGGPTAAASAPKTYAAVPARVLTAEQIFDSLSVVVGESAVMGFLREQSVSNLRWESHNLRDEFVRFFDPKSEPDPLTFREGIPQLLRVMNEPGIQAGIERAVQRAAQRGGTPSATIDELFLIAYARRPSADERKLMLDFLGSDPKNAQKGYRGILWALLNSSEFITRT